MLQTVTDYIDIWIESVNSPPSIAGPNMVVAYLDDPAGPLEIAGITVAGPGCQRYLHLGCQWPLQLWPHHAVPHRQLWQNQFEVFAWF